MLASGRRQARPVCRPVEPASRQRPGVAPRGAQSELRAAPAGGCVPAAAASLPGLAAVLRPSEQGREGRSVQVGAGNAWTARARVSASGRERAPAGAGAQAGPARFPRASRGARTRLSRQGRCRSGRGVGAALRSWPHAGQRWSAQRVAGPGRLRRAQGHQHMRAGSRPTPGPCSKGPMRWACSARCRPDGRRWQAGRSRVLSRGLWCAPGRLMPSGSGAACRLEPAGRHATCRPLQAYTSVLWSQRTVCVCCALRAMRPT